MVKVINKTTKAVFHMDTLTAKEILQKYHFVELAEASREEKAEIEQAKVDPNEMAILGGKLPASDKTKKSGK